MIRLATLRSYEAKTICLGSHPDIIQSMLDYDYLIGASEPSVRFIIANNRKHERYFWGEEEVMLPVKSSLQDIGRKDKSSINYLINFQSGRKVLKTTQEAFAQLPGLLMATIFAEQTPELHAITLGALAKQKRILLIGPSSVGFLLPGAIKLGAIGGTRYPQIQNAKIEESGDIAVISSSGGMVNEIIHEVTSTGNRISFALSLGGERYPALTPADAMLLAEADPKTKQIVYFGELGGEDEYEIIELIRQKKLTKHLIAYIAGTVAELFKEPPQFGHAKAMAKREIESARSKRQALAHMGVSVPQTFGGIRELLTDKNEDRKTHARPRSIPERNKRLMVSRLSGDFEGEVEILGLKLQDFVSNRSFAAICLSMLLGEVVTSKKLIQFTDHILRNLIDHGPYVSGAANTIIAARAGKDLVSSITAGLLTIGPRFGGAVNAAAGCWLEGAASGLETHKFVDTYVSNHGIIPGIGHKKYRTDQPDPRVVNMEKFAPRKIQYLQYARRVEKITTAKKGNLILNVDGMIAAIMLDLLASELKYTPKQLQELVDIEFFNALFVISRTVGFTAHFLDQKRNDEGLLRFSENEIRYIPKSKSIFQT